MSEVEKGERPLSSVSDIGTARQRTEALERSKQLHPSNKRTGSSEDLPVPAPHYDDKYCPTGPNNGHVVRLDSTPRCIFCGAGPRPTVDDYNNGRTAFLSIDE